MSYFLKSDYKLIGFRPSKTKHKMYDAVLRLKKNYKGRDKYIPFGDRRYGNYQDRTGLNLYPELIHGDKKRRKSYKARHKGFLRKGYYSAGWFSYFKLW